MNMNMYDIIYKKRTGNRLNREEIYYFVEGYTKGQIPDYQASALLMTFFLHPLTDGEIVDLTTAMCQSGDTVDLSPIEGIKVDKHSTGGVGDKTTLIALPVAAACGVPVAKMSGRGLGFTGGTIDKLESIPGMKTTLAEEEFLAQVNRLGLSIIGQTTNIAPADKKIYALRDVTATVDNLGLIASSVMSKKLAAGADAIVLDVKCGNGAFMKSAEDARALGKIMRTVGRTAGKNMVVLITDMNQPLGNAVGNSLEVIEVIETLKNKGPADIRLLSLTLAGTMICLGGLAETPEDGFRKAEEALESGRALEKMTAFLTAQGGDAGVIQDYGKFPQAKERRAVLAADTGFITAINTEAVGSASQRAGAGRETKDDPIDLSAGLLLQAKIGDRVTKGQPIAEIFGNDTAKLENAAEIYSAALRIENTLPICPPLILDVL
ncbi:pyrimidine-nucleoside phosphorylase [Clostridia bacterium]|nr:pyrimidine-nucleoside phosphorylase [Clostridia bacterium]